MADLIQIDTDEEMDKYAEAELISQNPPPVAAIKEKTLNYNPITGRNDVLTSLSTGGYVKVGEEELPRIEQVQQYARTLKNIGVPFDIAEYEAAGFSAEEVQAAGVMPMVQEKPKRTEPLREGEELRMRREGADMVAPLDQTLRQNTTNTLREIFVAAGLDNYQARQIAEGLIGNPNATRDLGIGIADFTPAGLFFGAQEGYRTFERGMNTGDPTTIGMGALEAGLSLLEAVPLTAAGAKAAKAGIPTLRQALVDLGQGAEARIAERGDTTLFSNPIEPAVDQALAMAGRAADEKPKGIKAFHGSGVDFDKFDLSFMGTGEGAQAYGKGLYFAEMEEVAQDYRQKLSGVLSNPLKEVLSPSDASPAAIAKAENDLKQAISFASISFSPKDAAKDFAAFTGREETPELVEAFTKAMSNKGRLYEVKINADPNELLDFDAPISEQPAKVQEVIAPFVERRLDEIEAVGREEVKKAKELGREFTPRTRSEILSTLKGGDILLLDKVETGQVSQALKDADVPGIKYLDRQSRNKNFEVKLSVKGKPYATEPLFATNKADAERIASEYQSKGFDAKIKNVGSSNYVILDDSLIDIVKKYGFGGFMVGAGVQSSLGVKESFEET